MTDLEAIYYPEKKAGGFSRLSGTIQFYQRVQALLRPGDTILDFGAGRGLGHDGGPSYAKKLRTLQGEGRRVIGVDVDPIVTTNPSLDEAHIIEPGKPLPFADATFDIIVTDFVLEHIGDAGQVARELDRVLKPGGWLCARTTNRYGYVSLASRMTPKRYRKKLASAALVEQEEDDIFHTHYRMNTLRALKKLFPPERYEHACFAFDSEPQYHFNKRLLFVALMTIHYLTPPYFRNTLVCFLHKNAASLKG